MTPIQILLIAFAAFAILVTFGRFRRRGTSVGAFAAWTVFWLAVAYVAARPDTASAFANFIGVGRGADAAIYLAMLILFYLIFRLFGRLDDIERELTKIVREEALKDLPEKDVQP